MRGYLPVRSKNCFMCCRKYLETYKTCGSKEIFFGLIPYPSFADFDGSIQPIKAQVLG
jgi:hypothetical protein